MIDAENLEPSPCFLGLSQIMNIESLRRMFFTVGLPIVVDVVDMQYPLIGYPTLDTFASE